MTFVYIRIEVEVVDLSTFVEHVLHGVFVPTLFLGGKTVVEVELCSMGDNGFRC